MSPPSTESTVFEISTASRETPPTAVETRSEFRYGNRRPRADSQPTCLNAPTSNHTTLLPRSRQKTCMVWKLKTTTAPFRELSNDQAPGLVFPNPTSPRGPTTRRRNSFRVPLRDQRVFLPIAHGSPLIFEWPWLCWHNGDHPVSLRCARRWGEVRMSETKTPTATAQVPDSR
jgi:hypothetical protein